MRLDVGAGRVVEEGLYKRQPVSYESRLRLLGVGVAGALLLLSARLWHLQVMRGDRYAVMAESNRIRQVPVTAPRGLIYDRAGRLLVGNRMSFTVSLLPSAGSADLQAVLRGLARVLGVDAAALAEAWRDGYRPGSPEPVRLWRDASPAQVIAVEEHRSQLPGVVVEEEPARSYLRGPSAAHVLGYVTLIGPQELSRLGALGYRNTDLVGRAGVERAYETVLKGMDGYRRIEVDALERPRRVLEEVAPVPGSDVYLTIDLALQQAVERALVSGIGAARSALQGTRAQASSFPPAGAAVVLDPATGAVLAMASFPAYDPGVLVPGRRERMDYLKLLEEDPSSPYLNRATRGLYPPGSTFKVITAMAALEERRLLPGERLEVDGYGPYGKLDWWKRLGIKGPDHPLSLPEAFEWSSNDFFWELGARLDIEGLARWARRFALGQPLGVDLYPPDEAGLVPDPLWKQQRFASQPGWDRRWYPSETLDVAIGQGFLQVTPIQVAAVYMAVANDGVVYRPYVVQSVRGPDGSVRLERRPEVLRVVRASPAHWRLVRQGLGRVVSAPHGTARGAFAGFPIPVGGKTGTAQLQGYEGEGHAWFVGIAPLDRPEVVVAVVVERGGGGAAAAAPIAREILSAYFRLTGRPGGPSGPS